MIRKVLVVDDEPLARERLVGLVRRTAPEAEVREAGNGDSAMREIREWAPDLVLLDVQMPGRSGLDVIESIGPDRMPRTIFTTAHDRYAVRAFEVAAVDYLLKPFEDERFVAAWRRAARAQARDRLLGEARRLADLVTAAGSGVPATSRPDEGRPFLERIAIKHDQRTTLVPVTDLVMLESSGNYVVLHTARGRHRVRGTLAHFESRLDPARFVRIHRRYLVDLGAMRELQPWFAGDQIMILQNGSRVRVSRRYRQRLARKLSGE